MLDEEFARVASTPMASTSTFADSEAVNEFAALLKSKIWERAKGSEEMELKGAFKAFSSDRSGVITFAQFVRVCERYGLAVSGDGKVIGGTPPAIMHSLFDRYSMSMDAPPPSATPQRATKFAASTTELYFSPSSGNGSEENTALLSWQDFAAGLFAEERQATPGEGLDNALPSQTEGNLFNGVTFNGTNVSTDPAIRPNNPNIARPVYRGGHGRSMASLAKPQAEAEAYQRSPQYQPSRLQYIEKPRWEGPH